MLIESNWTKWNTKLGNNPSRNLSFTDEDSIKSDSLGQQPKRKFGPNQKGWYGWFGIVQVLILHHLEHMRKVMKFWEHNT